jgi:hypothetical protein
MGSFSDHWENEILDHVFKTGAYTAPTNIYVALCKTTIQDDDTGSTLPGEVSGGAYARKVCNTWDAASGGATENTQTVTFAQATADWGTVTHFALCDHSSTGNMLAWGALSVAKNVQSGDTFTFATGDIDVTLT